MKRILLASALLALATVANAREGVWVALNKRDLVCEVAGPRWTSPQAWIDHLRETGRYGGYEVQRSDSGEVVWVTIYGYAAGTVDRMQVDMFSSMEGCLVALDSAKTVMATPEELK
jgi:hypothetical protein